MDGATQHSPHDKSLEVLQLAVTRWLLLYFLFILDYWDEKKKSSTGDEEIH